MSTAGTGPGGPEADGPPAAARRRTGGPPRGVCLRLAYEGTAFSGWQVQPGRRTVQGVLAEAIRAVSGEVLRPQGTSRTDAGVHALDQVAVFTSSSTLDAATWARALDTHLPPDVAVISARDVPPDYDPLAAAVGKRYRYRIHDAPARPVLDRHLVWRWRGRLDCAVVREAARHLEGEHDFTSFEKTPSTRVSKVRTIHEISVGRPAGVARSGADELWIEVEGNGFLHNMVRIIVGSLVMVGAGRRPPTWLAEALAARRRPAAGPTAPPQGLVLAATRLSPDPWHAFPISSAQ
jgi:tRNA pseudouridine38-40 synthase